MSLTERRENGLPEIELPAEATSLFRQVLETLVKNQGLKKVLVYKFLTNPQDLYPPDGPSQIKFKSKGNEYSLNIQRSVGFEEVSLSKMVGRVENKLTIWIQYHEIPEGHCSLFGGVRRGEANKAHLSYLEFDWHDSDKSIIYINNKEASEKSQKFIQQI